MKLRYLVFGLIACAFIARGADVTLYVNLQTVFEGYYKSIASNIALDDKANVLDDQLALQEKELETLASEAKRLDAERRNELLSAELRGASDRKFQACLERYRMKGQEFEKARSAGYRAIQAEQVSRSEELAQELIGIVNKIADEMKATHVIEVSGKTTNNVAVYLRYPKDKDITAKVLAAANAGHEKDVIDGKAEVEKRRANKAKKESAPVLPAAK